jgi:hypothetical protein
VLSFLSSAIFAEEVASVDDSVVGIALAPLMLFRNKKIGGWIRTNSKTPAHKYKLGKNKIFLFVE